MGTASVSAVFLVSDSDDTPNLCISWNALESAALVSLIFQTVLSIPRDARDLLVELSTVHLFALASRDGPHLWNPPNFFKSLFQPDMHAFRSPLGMLFRTQDRRSWQKSFQDFEICKICTFSTPFKTMFLKFFQLFFLKVQSGVEYL